MEENTTNIGTNSETKHDLVLTRIFDAPIALVWRAWIDPPLVMQWWGPADFTCPLAQIDFQEGGTSLVRMYSPEYGDYYSTWYYQSIKPMEHIDYIHNLSDQDGNKVDPVTLNMPSDFPQDQRHVVAFKALDDTRTEVTITEYDWTVGQMMEMSRIGMEQCFDKMTVLFTKTQHPAENR